MKSCTGHYDDNNDEFLISPLECVHGFRLVLRINKNYFPKHFLPTSLFDRDMYFFLEIVIEVLNISFSLSLLVRFIYFFLSRFQNLRLVVKTRQTLNIIQFRYNCIVIFVCS